MLGPKLYDTCSSKAIIKPGKDAIVSAFAAFPTKVSIPAGTYHLASGWQLDIEALAQLDPELVPPNDPEIKERFGTLGFAVAGAGRDSTTLKGPATSTPPLVLIQGNYDGSLAWNGGEFYGLELWGGGLGIENPNIHVRDLRILKVEHGISLHKNSLGCHFENVVIIGPQSSSPPANSSGFICTGGNVAGVVISRLAAQNFDVGINLVEVNGGIVAWKILNCDLEGNRIGIHIHAGMANGNDIAIRDVYMETWSGGPSWGIRFAREPYNPTYVRIEGGHIDPKAPGTRQIEIHGCSHVIDMPGHFIYGTIPPVGTCPSSTDYTRVIKAGIWCGELDPTVGGYGCPYDPEEVPYIPRSGSPRY